VIKWFGVMPAVLVLALALVQHTSGYVSLEQDFNDRVVVRRGLPWLGFLPLIGNDIILDTGFTVEDLERQQRGKIQGLRHWEWGNLQSGVLRHIDFIKGLGSPIAQSRLSYQTAQEDQGLSFFQTALKNPEANMREIAAEELAQLGQSAPTLAERLFSFFQEACRAPDRAVRRTAAEGLGHIAQAASEKTKAQVLDRLMDYDDAVREGLQSSLSQSLVHQAEEAIQQGRDATQFLLDHLEGRRSFMTNGGNANTYAVYRRVIVEAIALWLVSKKPEAQPKQQTLRERLAYTRDHDSRLHVRIAAWNVFMREAALRTQK
jgi:hypothetical protein